MIKKLLSLVIWVSVTVVGLNIRQIRLQPTNEPKRGIFPVPDYSMQIAAKLMENPKFDRALLKALIVRQGIAVGSNRSNIRRQQYIREMHS